MIINLTISYPLEYKFPVVINKGTCTVIIIKTIKISFDKLIETWLTD